MERTQDPVAQFFAEVQGNIARMGDDAALAGLSNIWVRETLPHKYAYNFTWLGRPIIQFPQDMLAIQEILWNVRPQLVIETGIAHGGSLILSASILELLGGDGRVLGVDIEIRPHNRREIERHPLARRIEMFEGSSIDPAIVEQVRARAAGKGPIVVILDSNHAHEHVLRELELYSPLVTPGSYLIVFDTVVEDLPAGSITNRPWGKGNNPKTAVHEFLRTTDCFEIDRTIQNKLLITAAPDGYLRCVKPPARTNGSHAGR